MAESLQGLDPPDWDPLWFLEGHPMRKELDRVMKEFVMDSINTDDPLIECSYRDFLSMVERFCDENGERFWGKRNRAHLGSGAPLWPDNERSIQMALRWEFRAVEDRLHQTLTAEARQRGRAHDRKGYQQAVAGVENHRPRPRSMDAAASARCNGGLDSNELMHPERRERILSGALENVLNPTITPSTTLALRQGSPIVKKERNMSFGNNGEHDDGNALLLAKFRGITQDGRRIPKRDAQSALQEDEVDNAQDGVVFKIPKHPRIQYTLDQNVLQGNQEHNAQGQVVVRIPKGPRVPFTPQQQQRDLIRCGVSQTYTPKHPPIQFTQQEQQEPRGGMLKTYASQHTYPSKHQQHNTTLHFFLSDPRLGAIPMSLQKCMERGVFLAEALTAWRGLEPGSSAPTLVSVRFHWAPVPMVLKWRDKAGFDMMLEAIAAAPCWQQLDHRCNVEVHGVKCRI